VVGFGGAKKLSLSFEFEFIIVANPRVVQKKKNFDMIFYGV
jgi:hypothetical protein